MDMDTGTTDEVKAVVTNKFEQFKYIFNYLLGESSLLEGLDFDTVSIFFYKVCKFNERLDVDIIRDRFDKVL